MTTPKRYVIDCTQLRRASLSDWKSGLSRDFNVYYQGAVYKMDSLCEEPREHIFIRGKICAWSWNIL